MRFSRFARVGVIGLTALALTMGTVGGASAADDPRKEKSKVDKQVEQLMDEFEGLSKDLATAYATLEDAKKRLPGAQAALTTAQAELKTAEEKDAQLADRLDAAESAQRKVGNDLKAGQASIEANQENVSKIARRAYQNGGVSSGVLAVLQLASGKQTSSDPTLVDSAVRTQNRVLTQLNEQRAVNRNNEARLTAIAAEIGDLKKQSEANVVAKTKAQDKAAAEQANVEDIISTQTSASKTLADNKAKTQKELDAEKAEQDKLAKEVYELQKKEEAARIKAGEAPSGKPMSRTQGKFLSNPAAGYRITSPFGWRVHPITGARRLHTGTDFGVPCGTPVRAAAPGTVIQAGWAGGYGNRVAVSHGKVDGVSLATTYNHNSKLVVHAGQKVTRGQVISYSGTTGASTGCHLHFEVMRNGTYVNPLGWI